MGFVSYGHPSLLLGRVLRPKQTVRLLRIVLFERVPHCCSGFPQPERSLAGPFYSPWEARRRTMTAVLRCSSLVRTLCHATCPIDAVNGQSNRRVTHDSGVETREPQRLGLATAAARAGNSERAIMNQTGHRSVQMVRKYMRSGSLFLENAAAGLL